MPDLYAVPEAAPAEEKAAQTIERLSDLIELDMREHGCAPAAIEAMEMIADLAVSMTATMLRMPEDVRVLLEEALGGSSWNV